MELQFIVKELMEGGGAILLIVRAQLRRRHLFSNNHSNVLVHLKNVRSLIAQLPREEEYILILQKIQC
jgi:hypothetical protein